MEMETHVNGIDGDVDWFAFDIYPHATVKELLKENDANGQNPSKQTEEAQIFASLYLIHIVRDFLETSCTKDNEEETLFLTPVTRAGPDISDESMLNAACYEYFRAKTNDLYYNYDIDMALEHIFKRFSLGPNVKETVRNRVIRTVVWLCDKEIQKSHQNMAAICDIRGDDDDDEDNENENGERKKQKEWSDRARRVWEAVNRY
jgi:hypothetical protein